MRTIDSEVWFLDEMGADMAMLDGDLRREPLFVRACDVDRASRDRLAWQLFVYCEVERGAILGDYAVADGSKVLRHCGSVTVTHGELVDERRIEDTQAFLLVSEKELYALDPSPGAYYVSARGGDQADLMAGPFVSHVQAMIAVPIVRDCAIASGQASGVVEFFETCRQETGAVSGRLNEAIDCDRIGHWLDRYVAQERVTSEQAPGPAM